MQNDRERSARILIIQESVHLSLQMVLFLEREGFEVAVAPNLERTLELQSRLPADVLIADFAGSTNIASKAIEQLKGRFPGTRIVVITRPTPHNRNGSSVEGADITLRERCPSQSLLKAIERLASMPRTSVP